MNYEEIKNKIMNRRFIYLYIGIFLFLYIFCSFIKFLGQLPVLLLITFFIAYYMSDLIQKKLFNSK